MSASAPVPVATVFLRHRGEVLLLRRSDEVESYPGRWGAVAGHVEQGDPHASARAEVEEETGLQETDVTLAQAGSPFTVDDEERGTRWRVHPFLFDADTRSITTNWETAEAEWTSPTALLRRDTVPDLWASYRRVAPSILSLTDDATHGSAYLSIRALEVLRDRAGMLATSDAATIGDARARLVGAAHRLLDARPSMAALVNRVHRVMHASGPEHAPGTVEAQAHEAIQAALTADRGAATQAASQVGGAHVLTLSRSGTVLDALRRAEPAPTVSIVASEPGGEGIAVAESLAGAGLDVTLLPDAAGARRLREGPVEAVLVGADAVLPSGALINKVGTYAVALAAHRAGVPLYAACAVDKVTVDDKAPTDESAPMQSVYDGPVDLSVWAPRFETTPADLVSGGLFTERGLRAASAVQPLAEELNALRTWPTE